MAKKLVSTLGPAKFQKRPAGAPASSGKPTSESAEAEKPRVARAFQSLRGVRDILPNEQPYWEYLRESCRRISEDYGFERIELPIIEPTALFERGVGKVTDIVEKEMFTFQDRSGDSITLRPEFTAGAARAYVEHGQVNQPQPVKWYTDGTIYRYERPQYGRQREFHQWNWEVLGDPSPVTDALLIIMAINLYADLGLPVVVQVNSIGDQACRPVYLKVLTDYYKPHRRQLCETCQVRLQKNHLRLLDCKEEQCQAVKTNAPQFVDHLCEACKDHLMRVVEYLDDLDVPYALNSHLVRGFDYYTRTVFEVWAADDERGKTSLCGGGRYDKLLELLGGRPTAACGMGLGMEVAVIKMKEKEVTLPATRRADVFIAQLGDVAKRKALQLFEELRKSGVRVAGNFAKDGLKGQMDLADKIGVRYTLIIGQKELMDGTIIIRDMEAGIQEIYDFKKVIPEVQRKLQKSSPSNGNGSSSASIDELVLPPHIVS